MTQFQPPPDAPRELSGGQGFPPESGQGQAPWSAAAIAGFVLSLLGCLGVTALLGLVLGIVGIVRTRGGQRRGMGLAVAALPISVVTGLISVFVVLSTVLVGSTMAVAMKLPTVFEQGTPEAETALSALRAHCSEGFNAAVNPEQFDTWLAQVSAKHGKLMGFEGRPTRVPPDPGSNEWGLAFEGKFVDGPASVHFSFIQDGFRPKIVDLSVDGFSVRDAE